MTYAYQLFLSSLIGKLFHFNPKFPAEFRKEKVRKYEKLHIVEKRDDRKKSYVSEDQGNMDDALLKKRLKEATEGKSCDSHHHSPEHEHDHHSDHSHDEGDHELDPFTRRKKREIKKLIR